MKNTTNTKTTNTTTENGDIKIVGKRVEFVINNDENNEKTKKATVAFIEWLKTSFNSRKYIDHYGIIPGGWCIDITDVVSFNHVATAQDSITGGIVDVIYLTFENSLLNRFAYIDHAILERGTILLPIDNKIEYVPFGFKYVNGTKKRKTPTKKTPTKTDKTTKTTATDTTKKGGNR
jgi:hypothetical protein